MQFQNIDIDIDIDMVILENNDIDTAILQNIDIDKISNRFKFGISNRATPHTWEYACYLMISQGKYALSSYLKRRII